MELLSLSGGAKRIESLVRKAVYTFDMIASDEPLVVALSGGKDSLTLLHVLHRIAGRGLPAYKLHAVHVSGAFSCGAGIDENYLRSICNDLEVPLHVRHAEQSLETLECYSCSRQRRRILFDAAKELGSSTVAFGHHRDDHIQTLLMNLLHKGEFAGNLAKVPMVKYGITIIRPLLFVTEEEIINYARQHQFLRAMCRCPVGQNSLRKRTAQLLAEIEATFPNARGNLARAGWEQGSEGALQP
jgi:tRNA 2-thiocytidine biosynthesis protein TtcA